VNTSTRRVVFLFHRCKPNFSQQLPQLQSQKRRCPIKPTPTPSKDEIKMLIAQLNDPTFRIRETAAKRLRQLGPEADALLKEAAPAQLSLELRRRLEEHYAGRARVIDAGHLQATRAVRLLEMIDSMAAREVLRTLSHGAPGAWLTQDAESALRRLGR
jgi:hypothetical protein